MLFRNRLSTKMPKKTLFIGNIAYKATPQDIEQLFARFGGTGARIMEGKGVAFVDVDADFVGEAIAVTHGKPFLGRELRVKIADQN
jgi:RNA recognition motif-containing protein